MTDELWQRHVFHGDEDPWVAAIFAVVTPAVAARYARSQKQYKLRKKDKRDVATDQLLFSRVFNYASAVLNVPASDLFLQHDQPLGLTPLNTTGVPSFVVGADLLQGRPEKELAFAIAKQLCFLRLEHFLCVVLQSPRQLRTVFLAALRLSNPNFPIPQEEVSEVDKLLKYLRSRVNGTQLEQLHGFVKHFIAKKGEIDLKKWHSSVQLTSNRAALILANDLEVAARMVSTEPVTVGSLAPKEKVKELVTYAVCEDYFRVRADLGLQVGK